VGFPGDSIPRKMEAKLARRFSARGPKVLPLKRLKIQFTSAKPGYYERSNANDVNQSWIRIVGCTTRNIPTTNANRSFQTRLSAEALRPPDPKYSTAQDSLRRGRRGIGTRIRSPGMIQLAMATKKRNHGERRIHSLYEQIDLLKTNPVSDQELARAQGHHPEHFVFNFDTPGKVLQERMAYELLRIPGGFSGALSLRNWKR